jgi:hypothetical protein
MVFALSSRLEDHLMKATCRERSALLCLSAVVTGAMVLAVVHAVAWSAAAGTEVPAGPRHVQEETASDTDGHGVAVSACHGENTICSVLGYDFDSVSFECRGLDQDIFRFTGGEGERVCIRLEANPPDPGVGKRALLVLTNRTLGLRLFRRLNTGLPHGIAVTLPVTGEYCVVVAESPLTPGDRVCVGERYKGDYCITLKASPDTLNTFEEAASVEPRYEQGVSGLI